MCVPVQDKAEARVWVVESSIKREAEAAAHINTDEARQLISDNA